MEKFISYHWLQRVYIVTVRIGISLLDNKNEIKWNPLSLRFLKPKRNFEFLLLMLKVQLACMRKQGMRKSLHFLEKNFAESLQHLICVTKSWLVHWLKDWVCLNSSEIVELKCESKSLLSKVFYQNKLYIYLYGMSFYCAISGELTSHLKAANDFSSIKNKYIFVMLKFC